MIGSLPLTSPRSRTAATNGALRRGFTLVELLVTMLVIAILASVLLAGLYSTAERAKLDRTKSTIGKINSQLLLHWDGYRTRRLPIFLVQGESPQQFAARQLLFRWQLQRVELPDKYDDITFTPRYPNIAGLHPSFRNQTITQLVNNPHKIAMNARLRGSRTAVNQSSECLYLAMEVGLNSDSIVPLMDSEYGDTDRDDMYEFLDGWGNAIEFIRWPAGFFSEIQRVNVLADPDPFDPRGVGRPGMAGNTVRPPTESGESTNFGPNDYGYRLYPLIVSAGPDGEYGLVFGISADLNKRNNPYARVNVPGLGFVRRGTTVPGQEGGGALDNVHNHLLEVR
jgi:prepilin-type N-terminal cleavage/methylation domain-containing protein